MADRADMADRANSRVILPPMAYIDGKSEIISHWPTDSTNYKEMLSHLKKGFFVRKQIIKGFYDILLRMTSLNR